MIDAFTASELAALRSQPQSFKPKLTAFRPATVWQGVVNGAHAKGARAISVTTTSGNISDILAQTVLLIGIADVNQQRVRIRSAAGSTIHVAENALDWESGQVLTALLYFEPTPIANRIVQSGTTATYYEDYDIPYTDQNKNFDPYVNIGPAAYVLELDCESSGTYAELTPPNESFVYDSAITGYQWGVLTGAGDPYDAEIIGSSSGTVCKFRFWDVGDYYIWCTATAANGKSSTGYRPVMVRCSTAGHPYSPFTEFEIKTLSATREQGYWTASISIFEDCDETVLPRNVPIVLYGDLAQGTGVGRNTNPIPWYYEATAHQRFVGWIMTEIWNDEYMKKGKPVKFEAAGLLGYMDNKDGYPGWIRYKTTPNDWTGMAGLTPDRMVYFMLKNRSTLHLLTDFHPSGDSRLTHYAEVPHGKFTTGLNSFLDGTIYAGFMSDRCSALWVEVDGQLYQDADRPSHVVSMHAATAEDHMNEIEIHDTVDKPEVSWLSIDGLSFDGNSDTPLISYAPGYVISMRGGGPQTTSGLVTPPTQTELNILAGRLYALKNNPYKNVPYETQGVWPYDIVPQTSITYEMASGTFREETIQPSEFILQGVTDRFHPKQVGLTVELTLEAVLRDYDADVGRNEPRAVNGVEGLFPPDPTGIDPGDYAINWPDIGWNIPPLTISPSVPYSGEGMSILATPAMYALTLSGHIARTRNPGDYASASWEIVCSLAQFTGSAVNVWMRLDPWNPKMAAYVLGLDSSSYLKLYYVENLDAAPGQQTITLLYTSAGTSYGGYCDLQASINVEGFVSFSYLLNGYGGGGRNGPTIAKRSSYAGGFSEVTSNSDINSPLQFGCSLTLGYHAASAASGKLWLGKTYRLLTSSNMGSTLSVCYWSTNVYPAAVLAPYSNNPDDDIFYVLMYDGTLYRFDAGCGSAPADITPDVGAGPSHNSYASDALHVYTLDQDAVSIIKRHSGPTRTQLSRSLDGGASWIYPAMIAGEYSWMGGWPYDPLVFEICGVSAPDILLTLDGGSSWYSVLGDYVAVTGDAAARLLAPVWIP